MVRFLDMEQRERIAHVTNLIELGRLHATVRYGMLGKPEIGIPVKDGIFVWGEMPETHEEDAEFARELIARANKEAGRI